MYFSRALFEFAYVRYINSLYKENKANAINKGFSENPGRVSVTHSYGQAP